MRLLDGLENMTDLLAGGAVNAGVGHPVLPFQQMLVLFGQTGKDPSLERVGLHIFDARLDLAFVPRRIRLGRQNEISHSARFYDRSDPLVSVNCKAI